VLPAPSQYLTCILQMKPKFWSRDRNEIIETETEILQTGLVSMTLMPLELLLLDVVVTSGKAALQRNLQNEAIPVTQPTS